MAERYLPLYRKYRPQSFKDLIGQENIVKALSNAINLNKISHAYLLCGPRGTGKTTTARIIAKCLNCAEGPTLEPCEKCPSCKDIANSTPIDVIEIDAASNRKVEDARNILEKIQFVPVNGRFKIYIIDEVHMLTTEAFNTLLKTLEEPPENVIFILATTEPHKVLDTIISRCQRFDFRRITTEDIVGRLKYICEQEKIKITEDALYTIARSSQGGMRDSLALLDQISVLDADKEITSDDVNDILGRLSFDVLFDFSSSVIASKIQDALTLLDSVYNKGNEPFQIISNLIQYFRNMLVVKNCSDRKIAAELTQLSEAHILKLREQSQDIEAEQILYIIERLAFYSKEIKETTNRYLWLELCVIELSSNIKYSSYSDLLKRLVKIESQIASGEFSSNTQKHSSMFKMPQLKEKEEPSNSINKPLQKESPDEVKSVETDVLQVIDSTPVTQTVEQKNDVSTISHNESQDIEDTSKEEKEFFENKQTNETSNDDIVSIWHSILQNIDSVPSRMFFYNLSRPVSLNKDGIEIAFMKDIFVKQAKEPTKNAPLKKAAMEFFNVPDINIHIRLADENTPDLSKSKQFLEKIERKPVLQTKKEEEIPLYEEENLQMLKDELTPHVDNNLEDNTVIKENLSDNAKMVMELFNGKYVD